jgi:uncharacterized protein YacL
VSKTVWRILVVVLGGLLGFLGTSVGRGGEWRVLGGVLTGVVLGLVVVALDHGLRRVPGKRLLQALLGLLVGLGLGWVAAAIAVSLLVALPAEIEVVLRALCLVGGAFLGAAVALDKGQEWNLAAMVRVLKEQPRAESYKLLDTSVIIDGRIADITETGFLEGTLVIPQFILRELQHIADSSDPLKRNRGRRGLDILQKIQKKVDIRVEISEMEFPEIREVDNKLVAMAKALNAKIVTNDFNLNKVAELHGVGVLNINELTNALRPVVLPGEDMRVYVLKEGKEYNQGIAYLDDGTMVVVDNGRRHIGQTIDVCVTSVLQTTAGRMIFSRLKEEAEAA